MIQNKRVRRGEIYWCDLGEAVGSEQGGCRPVIIVQNDIGNNYSTTTIVVPLTTKIKKTKLPTHHEFENNGVKQVACAEQIRTVDKLRLGSNLGFVRKEDVDEISRCVHIAVEEIEFKVKSSFRTNSYNGKGKYGTGKRDGKSYSSRQNEEGHKSFELEEKEELEEVVGGAEVAKVSFVEGNKGEEHGGEALSVESKGEGGNQEGERYGKKSGRKNYYRKKKYYGNNGRNGRDEG